MINTAAAERLRQRIANRQATVEPGNAQQLIDRHFASARSNPDTGNLLRVGAALVQLPQEIQQQAWLNALRIMDRSSSEGQQRLAEENARLKQPPHPVGVLETVHKDTSGVTLARVVNGKGLYEVPISTDVVHDDLIPGREVVLAEKNSAVLEVRDLPRAVASCEFDRHLEDGRLLAKMGPDRSLVLVPGGALLDEELRDSLRPGDVVEYIAETQRAVRIADRAVQTHEFVGEPPDVSRDDLGGIEEIWSTIEEQIIGPICDPGLYRAYGIEPARGVLLHGSPGTGKTSLIKAISRHILEEKGVDTKARVLFMISGPTLLRSFVGQGEGMLRAVVRAAEDAAEAYGFSMVLLDDFEYCALHRGMADASTPAYSALTNTLTAEMGGLVSRNSNVVFMATANRPDLVDSALLRAGRFSVHLKVPRPGLDACKAITRVYLGKVPLADGMDRDALADGVAQRVFAAEDDNLLLRLHFADAEMLEIFPPRIISGAILEAAVRGASLRAVARDCATGHDQPSGVRQRDLIDSLDTQVRNAVDVITVSNVQKHFLELPNDRRVVAVDHVATVSADSDEVFVE